jgi:2-octaprenyl-6-methoxyphenol hydroxylase
MRSYRKQHRKQLQRLKVQEYDVAIIGGGLVGAAFARAIAASGIKTVVIDQQPAACAYSPALDNRGLALSHTSAQILATLGVWDQIAAKSYPIKTVHVSEQGSFGFTKLNATTVKLPALGYVISASNLGGALIQDLELLPDICVKRPVEIKGITFDAVDNCWSIMLSDNKLKAKLLIAADGSNSFLGQRLNIPVTSIDYQQTAIVTNLGITSTNLDIAYERFTTHGVLALLPFGSGKVKCVWTIDNNSQEEFNNLNDQQFINKVQAAFGFRLGKFISIDKRVSFPIKQSQATRIYGECAVLLGNAANTLHPVAAQGFNLGLRDVATLARIILTAKNNGVAINSASMLQDYALLRTADQQATQNSTNSLVELFGAKTLLPTLARRFGLLAAQFIPAINRRIIAQGLGKWT